MAQAGAPAARDGHLLATACNPLTCRRVRTIKGARMAVRTQWLVAPTDTGSEVTPIRDVVAHTPGDDCACLPYVEFVQGDGQSGWMVVHHAWDGRG